MAPPRIRSRPAAARLSAPARAARTSRSACGLASNEQITATARPAARIPSIFDYQASLWTLELVAKEAYRRGPTAIRVVGETIRAMLVRLVVLRSSAKYWIISRDPAYQRKKAT